MPIHDELPSGAELDQLLGGDFPADPTPSSEPAAVVEGGQTPPPQAEPQQQQQQQQPAWNPDGPGDPAKALVEKNREIAELKTAYQQMYQQAAQMQHVLTNPQALSQYMQQQQAVSEPEPEPIDFSTLDPVTDPDGAFSALVKKIQQQEQTIQQLQQGINQTSHESRFALARESARQRHPDYDQVVQRLSSIEGMLNPTVFLGPNGPELAYKLAKSLATEQEVQTQVQQQVSAQAQRLIPTPPQAPPSLSRLPVVAPNNDARGDIASMSMDQIEKVGVHDWYDRALRGVS